MIDDDADPRPPRAGPSRPTTPCCAARPRTRTSSSRPARRSTPSTWPAPASCRTRWTAFAPATGRQYRLFDYVGRPRGRAGDRPDGLRRPRRPRRRWTTSPARRREGRRAQGAALPPLRGRSASSRPCRPRSQAIAVLDRTKEPGSAGEPLYQDVVDRAQRGGRGRRPSHAPRVVGGRYGLASKEFTPAMVKAVFDELRRSGRRTTSPSASSTTSRTPASLRPAFSHRAGRRVRGRLLRPGLGRHGRGQQELDQDHRRGDGRPTPRATSSTTRRRPARPRSRTCASAPARSAPPT